MGIESGLLCIAASLQAPAVGLFGTAYIPAYSAVQPINPRARYLQAEGALDNISVESVLEGVEQIVSQFSAVLLSPRQVTLFVRIGSPEPA